ncbi:MAG: discoidin domain-containing protein [Proteobacteria bacterium]|nr:discoidin domain-containing protein [Pseudomonadota bacterium]MBU4382606.1 discoidin domain-containing protein [Pseudomonadota bacterium]MCG2765122.1 discoidin domain-containing protein [Desulfarculaceae bacterium]
MPPGADHPHPHRWPLALGLAGCVALYWVVRLWLISCPSLSQVDYDEAVTGLMALEILQGKHQLLFWGQPYMGTLEAYLAALLFKLFGPSTLMLRLSLLIYGSAGVLALYSLGRSAGGRRLGLLAACLWSLPPLFLSFQGVYVTGGHLEAVVAGALLLAGACRLAFDPPRRAGLWALGLGVVGGLGLWSSLLILPLVAASLLGLCLARPVWLTGRGPWLAGLGLLLGAAPLLVWNAEHHWLTLVQVGGSQLSRAWSNAGMLISNVWTPMLTGAWWDGRSVASEMPSLVPMAALALIYLPALGLAVAALVGWTRRAWRRQNPWQSPADLVALALWVLLLLHASSGHGHKAILRYATPLMVPLTVLAALWLGKVNRWRPLLGAGLVLGLLVFNLYTHHLYLERFAGTPHRPVEAVLEVLANKGVDFSYAHGRVALPLTFESRGKVLAADFFGARNLSHLRQVDAAAQPAWVTHKRLAVPAPTMLGRALRRLGVWKKPLEVEQYVVWHDFDPAPALSPLPSHSWRGETTQGQAAAVLDRNLDTAWQGKADRPSQLRLDLGAPQPVARISLLPGPAWRGKSGMLYNLTVEGSLDGKTWQTLAGGEGCMAGLTWRGKRVKLEPVPALEFTFPAQNVRWLRLEIRPGNPSWPPLEIAELFLYQPDAGPSRWPQDAERHVKLGRQALAAWESRPTAPFPAGHAAFARFWASQVNWSKVVRHLNRAACVAPEWERPYRLLLEAARKSNQPHGSLRGSSPCPPPDRS